MADEINEKGSESREFSQPKHLHGEIPETQNFGSHQNTKIQTPTIEIESKKGDPELLNDITQK